MIETFGTVAVLDAKDMKVGQRIELGGKLCEVSKIEGQNVFFSVVVGWPLFQHRMKNLWKEYGTTLIATIVIVVVAYVLYFKVNWNWLR